jgi:hypothetical protein
MKVRLGILLFTLASGMTVAQTQVPHTFSSGQPARASDVNENFSALEAAVNRNADDIAAIGSSSSSGFDLALVDGTTGVQVGISGAGGDVWKLITPPGDELVQYGWPSPLPVVDTQVSVFDHWLWAVNAFYSCDDATLLGWNSAWLPETGQSVLPAQSDNSYVTQQFGSLPNGDVVLANVEQNSSIVWNGNYTGTPLDPAWDGVGPSPISFDCAIYVSVTLGDRTELKWSPFNMSWSTTLQDIVHNAHLSADLMGPYSVTPYVWIANDLVNGDPNPGNPLMDAIIDQCSALAAQPCEVGQNTTAPVFNYGALLSINLKKASYTQTQGVSAVSPLAELPGNRGAPRFFTRVWK